MIPDEQKERRIFVYRNREVSGWVVYDPHAHPRPRWTDFATWAEALDHANRLARWGAS